MTESGLVQTHPLSLPSDRVNQRPWWHETQMRGTRHNGDWELANKKQSVHRAVVIFALAHNDRITAAEELSTRAFAAVT